MFGRKPPPPPPAPPPAPAVGLAFLATPAMRRFYPPSDYSAPSYIAIAVILLSMLYFVFGRSREGQMAKQRDAKRERYSQGLKLMAEAEAKKDEEHSKSKPDAAPRTKGLPEASRIFGYLFDEIEDVPTTQFGVCGSDLDAARSLLDRAIGAELDRAKLLSEASLRVADLEATWLEENGTKMAEVLGHSSGDKLDTKIKLAERVREKLGRSALSKSTTELVRVSEALKRRMRRPSDVALQTVREICVSCAPMWLSALLISFLGPILHTEFDLILLSPESVTNAFRADGSWDRDFSRERATTTAAIVVLWMVAMMTSNMLMQASKTRFSIQLKSRFLRSLLGQDYEFYEAHGAGVLQEKLNSDVEQVAQSLLSMPKEFLQIVFRLFIKIYGVLGVAPLDVTLIALAPMPFVAYLSTRLMTFRRRAGERGRKMAEKSVAGTMDMITNIKTVRGFAMESEEAMRYESSIVLQAALNQATSFITESAMHFFIVLLLLSTTYVTYVCTERAADGQMLASRVPFIVINVGFHIRGNIEALINMFPQLMNMLLPLNRVLDHLSAKGKIEPVPGGAPPATPSGKPPFVPPSGKIEGAIRFEEVKFSYPTDLRKVVLDGLSFTIEKGQKLGICGSAGCGKSTAIQLIQRLYDVDPSGGAVFVDGVDIREYDVHFLRRRICTVAQQTILFKTSIRENVAYGCSPMPSDAEIKDALEKAQAWSFVDAKPDKLLTELTQTGGGFSGGQMQRLSIARALIRNPDVILLDEATAALDPVNERAVQDTLDRVMRGFTTIAIAHRLTTSKAARLSNSWCSVEAIRSNQKQSEAIRSNQKQGSRTRGARLSHADGPTPLALRFTSG